MYIYIYSVVITCARCACYAILKGPTYWSIQVDGPHPHPSGLDPFKWTKPLDRLHNPFELIELVGPG